jgi:aspartyl-tRNA(Asn)/glutamyl-tRNA(Gln) amidotransferase subunit A
MLMKEFAPNYDAACYRRMKLMGAVFVGKTNMDEFGMGSYGRNSGILDPVRNPRFLSGDDARMAADQEYFSC